MISLLSAAGMAMTFGPPVVLGGLVVFVLMRYLGGGRQGVSPVRVHAGQFAKLIEGAIAGNKTMVTEALRQSFELDLTGGHLPSVLAEWALFQAEQRVKDPNKPAPAIEAIAKFTGLTQEEVLAIIREDFAPRPATPATGGASA